MASRLVLVCGCAWVVCVLLVCLCAACSRARFGFVIDIARSGASCRFIAASAPLLRSYLTAACSSEVWVALQLFARRDSVDVAACGQGLSRRSGSLVPHAVVSLHRSCRVSYYRSRLSGAPSSVASPLLSLFLLWPSGARSGTCRHRVSSDRGFGGSPKASGMAQGVFVLGQPCVSVDGGSESGKFDDSTSRLALPKGGFMSGGMSCASSFACRTSCCHAKRTACTLRCRALESSSQELQLP